MPLARRVTVHRPDFTSRTYQAGDEPSVSDARLILNPDAWVGGVVPYPDLGGEESGKFIAHLSAPQAGLQAGGSVVVWTAIDHDPNGWHGNPGQLIGPLPAGLYDVGYWFLTSTATGAKSVLLAVGAEVPYGHNHGAVQQISGFFPDVAVDEGESIGLAVAAASAANLNGGRVVVRRSGDPFG